MHLAETAYNMPTGMLLHEAGRQFAMAELVRDGWQRTLYERGGWFLLLVWAERTCGVKGLDGVAMPDLKTYDAANEGLPYPATFQDFMGVIARWARARHLDPSLPLQDYMQAFTSSIDELNDSLAVFRQVWANAEAGRIAGGSAVPRVGPEGWKRLAESQQALAETERLIREIDEQYGLGEAAYYGVPEAPARSSEAATTDQLLELAGALEQRRGLAIVEAVTALAAGYHEGAFRAGFETACEEITLRLRTEVWEGCLRPVDAPKAGPVCGNCDTALPEGCGGQFKDDGDACALNRTSGVLGTEGVNDGSR